MTTRLSLIVATKGAARKQRRTKAVDVAFALTSQFDQKAFSSNLPNLTYKYTYMETSSSQKTPISSNQEENYFRGMNVDLFPSNGEGEKCDDVKPPSSVW